MARRAHLLAIGTMALGALLGYAAASGKFRLDQPPRAAAAVGSGVS